MFTKQNHGQKLNGYGTEPWLTLPSIDKQYLPREVRAKAYHRLLSLVYFDALSPLLWKTAKLLNDVYPSSIDTLLNNFQYKPVTFNYVMQLKCQKSLLYHNIISLPPLRLNADFFFIVFFFCNNC